MPRPLAPSPRACSRAQNVPGKGCWGQGGEGRRERDERKTRRVPTRLTFHLHLHPPLTPRRSQASPAGGWAPLPPRACSRACREGVGGREANAIFSEGQAADTATPSACRAARGQGSERLRRVHVRVEALQARLPAPQAALMCGASPFPTQEWHLRGKALQNGKGHKYEEGASAGIESHNPVDYHACWR